jgi:hypothetical protein
MNNLYKIPITIKINYLASSYSDIAGWPLIRILFNNQQVFNAEASGEYFEFVIFQDPDALSNILKVEHYGKNYLQDDKFFEIKKILINNVDIDSILWDSIQYPILPPWDSQENLEQPGNLYLGHNGSIVWNFSNPLMLDIQQRLGRTVKQISGQDTTKKVLEDVKDFFFNQCN